MTTLLARRPSSIWNDPFFEKLLGSHHHHPPQSYTPPIDVFSDDSHYRIWVDLPGFTKDELEVTLHNHVLTIKGNRAVQDKSDKTAGRRHLSERPAGPFNRSVRLPKDIDSEDVEATMKNGVLALTVSKKEESKPKRIELK